MRQKDGSSIENIDVQVHDDTAGATLALWGTSALSPVGGVVEAEDSTSIKGVVRGKAPWTAGETVLLLEAPGWKIGGATGFSLSTNTIFDVDPAVAEAERLRLWASQQKARKAINLPFPKYESRLRGIIEQIKSMSALNTTIEWKKFLDTRSTEELSGRVSSLITDDCKAMMDGDAPPTVAVLESLQAVRDNHNAGVYLGLIQPNLGEKADQKVYAYVGSATAVARGLQERVSNHLSPSYRSKRLESAPNYYHYRLLEDGSRVEKFYALAQTE